MSEDNICVDCNHPRENHTLYDDGDGRYDIRCNECESWCE